MGPTGVSSPGLATTTAIGEIAPIQQVGASKTYNSTPVTGTVRTIKSTAPRQRRAAGDDGERGA